MFLVLIETSGNQNYIFSTNKLKENIGASELTYRSGTLWVLNAIAEVTGNQRLRDSQDSRRLQQILLSVELNPPIENTQTRVEIIVSTSGKALLLVKDKADAQQIIQIVTTKALQEAPGLEIGGVFEEFDWQTEHLGQVNQKVHRAYELNRSCRPSSALRFLRLPLLNECSTSGLPALDWVKGREDTIVSAVSHSKHKIAPEAVKRLSAIPNQGNIRLVRSLDDLEKEFEQQLDWLAVIHADGNGLGEIFLNFHEHIQSDGESSNRAYVDKLRRFSIALDTCTQNAFITALNAFTPSSRSILPLVPLILGGDDLTVVCDGKFALPFIKKFLAAFEGETESNPDISPLARAALGVGRLSACAGVAIIKPHFPFSVAYNLAADLMQVAKTVKTKVTNPEKDHKPYPCSALDFHILYDSSDVDLDRIRGKLRPGVQTYLYHRPYVVTISERLNGATGIDWAGFHSWQQLEERIQVLLETDEEGRRRLPSSQTHDLRASLSEGKDIADARYRLIRDRYKDAGIVTLAGSQESLFQLEPETNIYMTALIDAIDAAEFVRTD